MRPPDVAAVPVAEERRAWLELLRWGLFVRAFEAADRGGITDLVERFVFVRRRLDPAAGPEALQGLLAHLAERHRAGDTWVYDRPTLADIVGVRMARRISDLGLLPTRVDRRELRPHTIRPTRRRTSPPRS